MIREEKNYWEYEIKRMDTDTYPADEESTGLRGISFGDLSLKPEELKALVENYHLTGSDCIEMAIEDNGPNGDGIWLSFYPATKLGTYKSDHIFAIRLTKKQACILAEALHAVVNLYKASAGGDGEWDSNQSWLNTELAPKQSNGQVHAKYPRPHGMNANVGTGCYGLQ
jgi:hypothetical protein